MAKNCRILPFFLFFPSLYFNKMHQKQERMNFLSPKEVKIARKCRKMAKIKKNSNFFSFSPPFFPSSPFSPLLFPFFPLLAVLYPPFSAWPSGLRRCNFPVVDWLGVSSNPAGDIYFHFEFFAPSPFRTGQRSRCK